MKARALYLPLLAAAALTACSSDEQEHLSQSQMADVMADMALAEGYLQDDPAMSGQQQRERLQLSVLKAHGVSKQEYEATLKWYGYNLDKYDALCLDAEKRLARKQARLSGSSGTDTKSQSNSLWPYSAMAMISKLSPASSLKFSIDRSTNADIAKPDDGKNFLTWSMRISNNPGVKVVLGVDYTDNSTTYFTDHPQGGDHIRTSLTLDKSKTISRIYGIMTIANKNALPVWADSIKLEFTRQPENQGRRHDYMPPTAADRKKRMQRAPTIKPIKDISNDSISTR